MDGIENIEFSSPDLVSVSKVEEDTTVGAIKERLGLECEYSAELTEEKIAEINAQGVNAGDWALIALHSFTSEEALTVTMKNGEVWFIRVTDAVYGAFPHDIKIDIVGNGGIELTEYYSDPYTPWNDEERVKTYFSARTVPMSLSYTEGYDWRNSTARNKRDIIAHAGQGYEFDHWEKNGQRLTGSQFSTDTIAAGTLPFSFVSTDTLTAVFRKTSSGGGGSNVNIDNIIAQWSTEITNDQPVVDKTASVYDYANRIYQVDITASSELYAVNRDLDIGFVTDVSRSMLFPSKLDRAASVNNANDLITKLDQVAAQNHNGTVPSRTAPGEYYYLIVKPQTASDVHVCRKVNGKWYRQAGANVGKYNDSDSVITGLQNGWREVKGVEVGDGTGNIFLDKLTKEHIIDKYVYVASDETQRIEYLKRALNIVKDILYKVDPDAKIGLTTFAKTANQGRFYTNSQQDQTALANAITNITLDDNTDQAAGLDAGKQLLDSESSNNKKKVMVLITDGAPNAPSTSPYAPLTWDKIQGVARGIKDAGIDIYTVGLSLENVQGATEGLYYTSSNSEEGKVGYAYDARDGIGLVEAVESIIDSIIVKASMTGSVSDTIDPAFYPVDKDGNPLQAGVEYTDEQGHTYTLTQSGDTWTVNWTDQEFKWAYTDEDNVKQPGWKGTVYVKAKENFLGGNAIKTNSGTENDKVTATGYKTILEIDENDNEVPGKSGPLKNEDGTTKTVTKPLSTPYVNVDELALTQNNTEWNVYLGTEVDPKSALKELLKKIDVRKVVSGDTNEMITSKEQMLGGTSTNSKTMALTDCLGLTTDAQIQALVNDLLTNGTKTYRYNSNIASAYGHGYVGDIVLTLENTSGCYNKDNHATEAVGKDAEFTLKVAYRPLTNAERNSSLGIKNDDYHTTPGGSAGTPVPKIGNDMSSTNHHVINVYVKGLQITKKDQSFSTKLIGAEFKLYRTSRAGETQNLKEIGGKNYYPVATLNMSTSSVATINSVEALRAGEEYYLVETKAPAGYLMLAEPIPVNLTFTNTYTPKPNGSATSDKPASWPYDWQQSATLTLGPSSWVRRTDATGENDLTQAGLDPSATTETMYYDIANDSGVELPNAGGLGTGPVYLVGVAIMGVASSWLVSERRKRAA